MSEERYLHCRVLSTDGVYRMNQVERLTDGRLFTLACIGNPTGTDISARSR